MANQPQSVNEFAPGKGVKFTVILKDGTEIVGKATKHTATSITLEDESIPRRSIKAIKYGNRVVAEVRARGWRAASEEKPKRTRGRKKKGARGRKKRLGRRTASGRPAAERATRKKRGRKKGARAGRRGRRPSAPSQTDVSITLNGSMLVFKRTGEGYEETMAVAVDAQARERLVEYGIPQA